MAGFRVEGLADLMQSFSEVAMLPDDVPMAMLDAGAAVLEEAQKEKARTMLSGPYSRGRVISGLKRKKPQKSGYGYIQRITFEGTVTDAYHKRPTRIAEIAFINEFGKQGQPARPFIQTANEEKAKEAVAAEAKVYDDFLKSKGL